MNILLIGCVALPATVVFVASMGRSTCPEITARTGTILTGTAAVLALILLVVVAMEGPIEALVWDHGAAVAGLYADRVSVLLLVLVLGVSAVVQSFATRYLRGDGQAERFFAATGVLTTATAAMVTAATLIVLAVAWSAVGLGLWVLLGLYQKSPSVPLARRRTGRAMLVGDAALWTAAALAIVAWGNVDLRGIDIGSLASASTAPLIACLLVFAAMARSALVPFSGWLPATIAAPTPVSALLHAGIINAGGVLLIRLHPMFDAFASATYLAFVAGAVTVVYGTTLMLTRPDIKTSLAFSTVGQMGFMVMACALGAYAAALFHLLAHGMYKATLFLGSGSAVRYQLARGAAPSRSVSTRPAKIGLGGYALIVPAATLAAAVWLWGSQLGATHSATVLLLFAWATGVWLVWGWSQRLPEVGSLLVITTFLGVVAVGYVGALTTLSVFVDPALRQTGPAVVSPWALAPVLLVISVLTLVRLYPTGNNLAALNKNLYVFALSAGDLGSGRPPIGTRTATVRRTQTRQLVRTGAGDPA